MSVTPPPVRRGFLPPCGPTTTPADGAAPLPSGAIPAPARRTSPLPNGPTTTPARRARLLLAFAAAFCAVLAGFASPAFAAPATAIPHPSPAGPVRPAITATPATAAAAAGRTAAAPATSGATATPGAPATPTAAAPVTATPAVQPAPGLQINLAPAAGTPATSQPLSIMLLLTVVSLGPAMMILLTSFTRIVIVLGLTRNALNLNGVPPNQVLIGLALFLTLFVMGPVFTKANAEAVQPFLKGEITQSEAMTKGIAPFREFMFHQTRESDLALFAKLSGKPEPANQDDIPTTTLIPAFVIGELRAAFLIGFVIFIPFLVIDILAGTALMSMGMVMLPPVLISLPFKLLLFVVVDGWYLVVQSLVKSFH